MKKAIKNIIKNLIGGIIGTGLILLALYLLGLIKSVIECHTWLLIPLGLYVIYLILKEI